MQPVSRRHVVRLTILMAASAYASSIMPVAGQGVPLAMKGYDPVAYFTVGKPVPGVPEFDYEWDDQRYRFSSAHHRDLFKADPVRYAPQFETFCAVAVAKAELVEGDPRYWLIRDDKLYLFGRPVTPEVLQSFSEIVGRASENRWVVK